MKRNVEIKKKLEFSNMIGEVIAISLENHLKFISSDRIEGNLTVLGKYKKTKASQLEEEFKYDIPVEITLTEEINPDSGIIDINDFYYDVMEESFILCNIILNIEGETIKKEEILDERECDGDPSSKKEIEIPHIEEVKKEEREEKEIDNSNSLFNIDDTNETYGSFIVYIVRQNETINTIIEKYNTTLEEIEKYNNIKNIEIGSKIIIPILNEENK